MNTLSSIWYLAWADCWQLLRRRETWFWAFVMPLVFFYFIGTVTSQFAGTPRKNDPIEVFIPQNAGFLAEELIKRLEQSGYSVVKITGRDTPVRVRRLLIPDNFTQSVQNAKPIKLHFLQPDAGAAGDYDTVRLSRSVYGLLADWIVLSQFPVPPDPQGFERIANEERLLTLETRVAGKRKIIPSGFEQAVPGNLVFFLLMNLLTVNAVTLVMGRDQGILKRLASAPLSRGAIVWSKWAGRMLVSLIQIFFLMLAGSVLFRVHWGEHLWMVLLVLVVFASFATALGFLVGCLVSTRAQASAIGSISANVLACIGGCWWPIEVMPQSMQTLSSFTPAGAAMSALHQLINFGSAPSAAVPQLTYLALGAIATGWLAARHFRFQ